MKRIYKMFRKLLFTLLVWGSLFSITQGGENICVTLEYILGMCNKIELYSLDDDMQAYARILRKEVLKEYKNSQPTDKVYWYRDSYILCINEYHNIGKNLGINHEH